VKEIPYDRTAAVSYARRWALSRNPAYYNFERLGGDCTNFASQCIFAGAGIMNYTPVFGWYYRSLADRTPSWTGVEFLYNFLTSNSSIGPYGHEVSRAEAQPGDIVQLADRSGDYYHSPVILSVFPTILTAAHSYDALDKPLPAYGSFSQRFIHIDAVRIP